MFWLCKTAKNFQKPSLGEGVKRNELLMTSILFTFVHSPTDKKINKLPDTNAKKKCRWVT